MSGDRDFVVLPRQALFEFFGLVALTPWAEDGDCAVKADQIIKWIESHDLSDVYIGQAATTMEAAG